MDMTFLIFLSSGLFLGWSLGASDAANIFGTAVGTKMVKFRTAAIISSIFIILGAVYVGSGASRTLGELGSINTLPGAFMAAFAAAITIYWSVKYSLPVSTSQAIVGSIIGWNFYAQKPTDVSVLTKIISTWIFCPILAGIIAIILYFIVRIITRRFNIHLLRLDCYTRAGLIIAGAFGAFALGANNIANVMGVFVNSSPIQGFNFHGFSLNGTQVLFLIGAVAISLGVCTYSKKIMDVVGSGIMSMTPVVAWIVVVSQGIVLILFASKSLESFLISHGLPSIPLVPVSSTQAIIGAVIGIGIAKGGQGIRWSIMGKIAIGWVITPIISAVMCFTALFFLENVFNQQVFLP